HDDVRVVRRNRLRPPGDSLLVVALLDHGSDHPSWADSLASAEQRLLAGALVEERRFEAFSVLVAEIEYVSHFDRRLKPQGAAALRTAVALDRLPAVGGVPPGGGVPP